jgi:hypothetical protein
MEQFKEIIDTYIENYSKFEKGKVSFDCEYGELIFFKDNSNILILFGIYIFPEQRNKGFCREILHYLIEQCTNKFDYFCVESVLSKILYTYLLRFKYKKMKNGFIFKLK